MFFHSILIYLTPSFSLIYFLNAVAEWANDALQGLGKGAPFSLFLTEKHFSQVAAARGNNGSLLSTVSFVIFIRICCNVFGVDCLDLRT